MNFLFYFKIYAAAYKFICLTAHNLFIKMKINANKIFCEAGVLPLAGQRQNFGQLFQHLKKTFNFLLFNIVFALDIILFLY